MSGALATRLSFELPPELEAREPAEARGMTRDAVRMLVADETDGSIVHSTFALLPHFLDPGDLVVVNTSGTIAAAVRASDQRGHALAFHFSTALDDGSWVVEPRRLAGTATERWTGDLRSRTFILDGDTRAILQLESPYRGSPRLWIATVSWPQAPLTWLATHGQPIRYAYVERPWPLTSYQNVYATEPGSAEMPSAGRPFTADMVMRLVGKGIGVTPIVLHTGVASLEADEVPYPERVRVPGFTATRVNATRAAGQRVIAIGTTVVRALESAADEDGVVAPFDGWTDVLITPERGVRAVDGLLTGWHEPEASHLLMLEALASRELLEASYQASLDRGYLWHEFGDVHLVLR